MLWVRWVRCLAMGVDPSNARRSGQIISSHMSGSRGPLHVSNKLVRIVAAGSVAVDRGRQFRVSAYNVRGCGLHVDSVPPPGDPSLPVREDSRRGRTVDRRTTNEAMSLICRRQSGSGDAKRPRQIEFRSFSQKPRCPTGTDISCRGQTGIISNTRPRDPGSSPSRLLHRSRNAL